MFNSMIYCLESFGEVLVRRLVGFGAVWGSLGEVFGRKNLQKLVFGGNRLEKPYSFIICLICFAIFPYVSAFERFWGVGAAAASASSGQTITAQSLY